MGKTSTEIAPLEVTVALDIDEQRMLRELASHLGKPDDETLVAILRDRHADLMRSGDLTGDVA